MVIKPVIPTYAFLASMDGDYFGALEKVANIGYRHIELLSMNYPAGKRFDEMYTTKEMRDQFDKIGLKPVTVHEQLGQKRLLDIDWEPVMDYYQEIGCKRFVQPNIWISTEDEALSWANDYNTLGEKMYDRGLQFYLHTHHFEFRKVADGRHLVDIIRENTDPRYLKFEFDTGWAWRGGVDPIVELEKFGDRCDIIHVKDIMSDFDDCVNLFDIMRREGLMEESDLMPIIQKYGRGQEFFTILGTGRQNNAEILRKASEWGHVKYAVAESEEKSNIQFKIAHIEYNYLTKHAAGKGD